MKPSSGAAMVQVSVCEGTTPLEVFTKLAVEKNRNVARRVCVAAALMVIVPALELIAVTVVPAGTPLAAATVHPATIPVVSMPVIVFEALVMLPSVLTGGLAEILKVPATTLLFRA